ncbi:AraC-like DNA-binding protein [Shimia isoporae]|uniref:AraC-like DNA-binding protein n=1 Tax=Shimia isoporae TaxID=647720 RepID=A0A4R1NVV0_9RHOB|nr:AraC family transcriptional regulator [Shimia isoporae]TCL09232.1 AraC-like DNA-binding protein [Shimia isoporae]
MPSKTDGFIRLPLVMPFVDLARSRGVDIASTLDRFELTREDIANPDRSVHAEVIYGLTNGLAKATKDPHFGFHVAEAFDIRQWQPTKDAFQRARTVGDFYTRFLLAVPQQASSVRHVLEVSADTATYTVNRLVRTRNQPEHVEGFGLGLHLRLLRQLLRDRWNGEQVSLLTPFPQAVPKTPLGVAVTQSNITGLGVRFPSHWLLLPVRQGTAAMETENTPVPEELSIVSALRTAARPQLEKRDLSLDDFAKELGMSPARLKATLQAQNTTFPREIKRLRIDVASELLRGSSTTVSDIGRQLGYNDQSHFARFFRSQTGLSPLEYRNKQLR